LATSKLIVLFLKIFIKNNNSKKKNYLKKYWILKNVSFVEMKISKLINYSTNMCQNCQGIILIVFQSSPIHKYERYNNIMWEII
jgi:hypothetical protein